jgi:hypothetical protein
LIEGYSGETIKMRSLPNDEADKGIPEIFLSFTDSVLFDLAKQSISGTHPNSTYLFRLLV